MVFDNMFNKYKILERPPYLIANLMQENKASVVSFKGLTLFLHSVALAIYLDLFQMQRS